VLAIFSPQILQTILGIISSLLGLVGIEI
jgi:hypothetical protein